MLLLRQSELTAQDLADEGYTTCGAASEIAALVGKEGFDYLDAPIQRIGTLAFPHPLSPPLHEAITPNAATIAAAVHEALGR